MIAVLSDLHLTDGTCRGSSPRIADLTETLERVRELAKQAEKDSFDLVMLGDTLDLLRSEKWADAGMSPAKLGRYDQGVDFIKSILQGIADNPANLQLFRWLQQLRLGEPPRLDRIYLIPGNHDRLVGEQGDDLAAELDRMFGPYRILPDEVVKEFDEIGLLLVHGHHWDPWNRPWSDKRARPCPYGDFIVVDLVNRLPREAAKSLALTLNDPVIRRYQNIEHVQPAMIPFWLMDCLEAELFANRDYVVRAWKRTKTEFRNPKAPWHDCRKWTYYIWRGKFGRGERNYKRRLRFALIGLFLMLRAPLSIPRWLRPWAGTIPARFWSHHIEVREDEHQIREARKLLDLGTFSPNVRFVVSGHTHRFLKKIPICYGVAHPRYINTGSWTFRIDKLNRRAEWVRRSKGAVVAFWRDAAGRLRYKILSSESSDTI